MLVVSAIRMSKEVSIREKYLTRSKSTDKAETQAETYDKTNAKKKGKGKVVLLHAMEALWVSGGTPPTLY
jgi:hypothetical protein